MACNQAASIVAGGRQIEGGHRGFRRHVGRLAAQRRQASILEEVQNEVSTAGHASRFPGE